MPFCITKFIIETLPHFLIFLAHTIPLTSKSSLQLAYHSSLCVPVAGARCWSQRWEGGGTINLYVFKIIYHIVF